MFQGRKLTRLFLPIFLLVFVATTTANAQTTIQVGGFNVQYWDPADGPAYAINTTYQVNEMSVFSQAEIDAMNRAFLYWSDVLNLDPADADAPIMRMINVTAAPFFNANALSAVTGGSHNVISRLQGGTPARDGGIDGRNVFFPANLGFGTGEITQLPDSPTSMEMIAIHELGHTLGVATYSHSPFLSQVMNISGVDTFTGMNAVNVYGGSGIPLAGDGGHTAIPYENITRGLVFGQDYRNVPHASPAELAILADLGFNVVLSDNFGRAYYQDNQTVTDNNSYSPGNRFGLGLYILSSNNSITQNGDLNASGDAGTGIRFVGGTGNTVNIGTATSINANGTNGVGIFASGGASHDIVVRGDVSATGTNGVGIMMDFGGGFIFASNTIDSTDYNAALVNDLDISGSVSGETDAIVIADTAGLNRLNFMNGASISGNIISNAIVSPGDNLFQPLMTFGYEADMNGQVTNTPDNAFSMTYNDDIGGSTLFDATFAGGQTNLGGTTTFDDAEILSGASLATSGTFNSSTLNLMNGGLLVNNGVVNSNSFVTEANSRIEGNGLINSSDPITLNGTTAPGNSIGTIMIDSDVIFSPTSMEEIEIQPSASPVAGTDNDLIQINGMATFNGGSVDVIGLPNNGAYTAGTSYTYVTASNGVVVNTAPTFTEDLINYRTLPFFTLNSAGFMLANDAPYGPQGGTYNQKRVGAYLDVVKLDMGNAQIQSLRTQLDLLPNTAAVRMALDQLSGEIYGTSAAYQIQSMSHLMDVLGNQVHHNHSPAFPCMDELWYSGYATAGQLDSDGNANSTDVDTIGHTFGKSWCLGPQTIMGAFYNYEDQQVQASKVGSKVDTDAHRIGLYLRDQRGMLHTVFTGFTGWMDSDSDRTVVVNALAEHNVGSYRGWNTGFLLEQGVTVGTDNVRVQPFFALQYLHAQAQDFTETGGSVTPLRVSDIDLNSFRTKLGSRLNMYHFRRLLSVDFEGAWVYEVGNSVADYQAGLTSTPGSQFSARGIDLGENWFQFGPSMNWMMGPFRTYVEYQAAIGEQANLHSGQWGTEFIW
ncbi:MAG: autotransporter domain-containing protein [Planctomycetaceae bacterium]|nr:autotransporter domain-containing protein [Planctomycetaceae bacterium]